MTMMSLHDDCCDGLVFDSVVSSHLGIIGSLLCFLYLRLSPLKPLCPTVESGVYLWISASFSVAVMSFKG